MLPTEGTYKFELLQLISVPINESGPLIHFITSFLVEFVLEIVVLFLELLGKLPDDIILEFE